MEQRYREVKREKMTENQVKMKDLETKEIEKKNH